MLISIAIPCYRSALTLPSVVREIKEEFAKHPGYEYEIILVNDGSPDNTFEVIREICSEDNRIIGVNLSRNFSQANAKMAALQYVNGENLVYMDDDGQHPADGIFKLIDKIAEGYDVAYAHFVSKKTSMFKVITSDLNGKILEKLGVKPAGIKTSSFIAWSRFAIEKAKLYHSPSPSTSSYLLRVTSKFADVEMEQRERIAGESGYSLKKLIALAVQGYTNFTIVPLRIADYVGAATALAGFVYGLILIIRKLCGADLEMGYTSIMAGMLIIGGMLMMMLGLLGEYVGRIYMLLSDTPQFMVREVINIGKTDNSDE